VSQISKAEFKQVYRNEVAPRLDRIYRARKKTLKKIYQIIAISAIVSPLATTLFIVLFDPINKFIEYFIVVCLLITLWVIYPIYRKFKIAYKRQAIRPLIETAFPGYSYSINSECTMEEFNRTKIGKRDANCWKAEDEITGQIEETSFRMSEVRATYETGGKNRSVTRILYGMLFKMDFNKNFKTHVVIRPDRAENMFGKYFGQKLQSLSTKMSDLSLIKMEDQRFEKEFVVLGKDQQEARYILSPSLLTRIMKIKRRYKAEIALSFFDNHLYLAISNNKDYFEPALWGKLFSFKDLKEIYELLHIANQVVDELDLNTRIWSKK
jgi:hypothetical protein